MTTSKKILFHRHIFDSQKFRRGRSSSTTAIEPTSLRRNEGRSNTDVENQNFFFESGCRDAFGSLALARTTKISAAPIRGSNVVRHLAAASRNDAKGVKCERATQRGETS
jgi:hypothetical protein